MRIADDVKIPVSLVGIRPEMSAAFPMIDSAYEKMGYEAILTSGTEGKHKVGSLHLKGLATDWRIRHVRVDLIPILVERIKKNLGGKQSRYDVVLEKDHLHVEFDAD
jgi:hypothetical protein